MSPLLELPGPPGHDGLYVEAEGPATDPFDWATLFSDPEPTLLFTRHRDGTYQKAEIESGPGWRVVRRSVVGAGGARLDEANFRWDGQWFEEHAAGPAAHQVRVPRTLILGVPFVPVAGPFAEIVARWAGPCAWRMGSWSARGFGAVLEAKAGTHALLTFIVAGWGELWLGETGGACFSGAVGGRRGTVRWGWLPAEPGPSG